MAIKIFIDQGHNPSGPNTGAEGFGLKEQDITYQVGKDLAALLRADERFEVRLSRNTPEERLGTSNATSLAARVRAAKHGRQIILSVFMLMPIQILLLMGQRSMSTANILSPIIWHSTY